MLNKDWDRWGSVDGDANADAIIRRRRRDFWIGQAQGLVNGVLCLGAAVWFGFTQNRWALVTTIVLASWTLTSAITNEIYEHHTFEMITERRTQLLEQGVCAVEEQLHDVQRDLIEVISLLKAQSGTDWDTD